jgi:hypothetical protein
MTAEWVVPQARERCEQESWSQQSHTSQTLKNRIIKEASTNAKINGKNYGACTKTLVGFKAQYSGQA